MKKLVLIAIIICSFLQIVLPAQSQFTNLTNKNSSLLGSRRFNINNISTIIWNDGRADVYSKNASYFYPILSGHTVNYSSGLIWAGYLGGTSLRMGGSAYRTNLQPGRILDNGKADVPGEYIYKARKDYKTFNVIKEAKDESTDDETVRNNYSVDEQNWPAEYGAPYDDVNKDGKYTPGNDIPGMPGADQTIWFVANDLDTIINKNSFTTMPAGVEMQCTVWGYYQGKPVDNMIFKKYLIINKNPEKKDFTNFYISYWSDSDIGAGQYDLCGCDTTLNLFYTYSALATNTQYSNTPPATGVCILQGPKVKTDNANDVAYSLDRVYKGYKNLPMTAHYYDIPYDGEIEDINSNSIYWYRRMQGKVWITGANYVDPLTKKTTLFPLSGDPINSTGWIDGTPYPAGDRRNGGACGSFNFAYGDTQEVVIAQITVGGTGGVNNIGAVALLKEAAKNAHLVYQMLSPEVLTEVKTNSELPSAFSLSQNYPNPFNPTTTINYSVPVETRHGESLQHVTLKVFDLLGREVATLVDEFKQAGNYQVQFSVETGYIPSLPSGIYFYCLQVGNYSETKKMVLMK
jgi:hypothetical protein